MCVVCLYHETLSHLHRFFSCVLLTFAVPVQALAIVTGRSDSLLVWDRHWPLEMFLKGG